MDKLIADGSLKTFICFLPILLIHMRTILSFQFSGFPILFILFMSCSNIPEGALEKTYEKWDVIEKVENIREFPTEVILSAQTRPYLVGNFLVIVDFKSVHNGVHIYNKNTFEYLTSVGILGKGPGEITQYYDVFPVKGTQTFWMYDHGKLIVYEFDIEEILKTKSKGGQFLPKNIYDFDTKAFVVNPDRILSPDRVIGAGFYPTSNSTYRLRPGKYNFISGEYQTWGYVHPESKNDNSRFWFTISDKHERYVIAYTTMDLMTICDLEGNLLYNIYGPNWDDSPTERRRNRYFHLVRIAGNYIFTPYLGNRGIVLDQYKRQRAVGSTQMIIFDIDGNYIKNMDLGEEIAWFAIDEVNNRVIVNFIYSDPSLCYFDLNFDLYD